MQPLPLGQNLAPHCVEIKIFSGTPTEVVERNTDGRSFKMIDGERVKVNFLIFYEMFDPRSLSRQFCAHGAVDDYDSEWVLLAGCTTQVVTLWCFNTGARDFDLGGGLHYSGSYPMAARDQANLPVQY